MSESDLNKPKLKLPPLSDKHKRFADRYFMTQNATASYKYVYKCKQRTAEVSSHRLLQRADVRQYLETLETLKCETLVEKRIANEQDILEEETHLALHRVPGCVDENGQLKDIHDWPESLQASIKEVEYDTAIVDAGDGQTKVERHIKKIKFYDKGQALARLEKVYGMNAPERQIHEHYAEIKQIFIELDGMDRGRLPQEGD